MKRFAAFLLPFLLLFSAATPALANVKAKNDRALLVLVSKEAQLQSIEKTDSYKLTLKGVNPKVIYFADRPARLSGQMSLDKFVSQWKTGTFAKVAPNAVIEVVRLDAKTKKLDSNQTTYAVTLYKPAQVTESNELSFEIKPLPGNKTALPVTAASDYVAVFIDDICLSCIG